MDERRFDALTKALAAAKPSRREALRRLAGGALGTVFGGVALERASAQEVGIEAKTCGDRCTENTDCNFGLRCGTESDRCFAIPDSRDDCDNDSQCELRYETCSDNGRCVNTVAPSGCDECEENGDCEDTDRICRNGRCIRPECTDHEDCGRRERCRRGRCVRRN